MNFDFGDDGLIRGIAAADDLAARGWAPGGYFHRACGSCGESFGGAKRCSRCANCALTIHLLAEADKTIILES